MEKKHSNEELSKIVNSNDNHEFNDKENVNEEQKINVKKVLFKLIEWILLLQGIFMILSSVRWAFMYDNTKWFNRLTLGIICLGFYAVIIKIDKIKNNIF